MKILITSFTFPPQANGVAEVVRAHAFGLAARGHEIVVATQPDPRRGAMKFPNGISVREFEVAGHWHRHRGYQGTVAAYQEFVASAAVDVVMCHCWQVWSTDLALPALGRNPARKILVSHGYDAHHRPRQPRFPWGFGQWLFGQPYVWRLPAMLRVLDHIVFLSPHVDRGRFFDHWVLKHFGGPPSSAIPNGADLELTAGTGTEFRREHSLDGAFMVLYLSSYMASKNQAAALRAFSAAGLPRTALVFIGHELNDYARHLQRLSEQLPRAEGSRVLFLEKLSREQIRAAYQAADLVMLTSVAETQPLVLLDAMACGKPFLSMDVGCVSELPGGVTVQCERELIAALRQLEKDADRRASLGREGLAAAQTQYHWNTVLALYDNLLRRVIAQPPRVNRQK